MEKHCPRAAAVWRVQSDRRIRQSFLTPFLPSFISDLQKGNRRGAPFPPPFLLLALPLFIGDREMLCNYGETFADSRFETI